MMTHSSPQSLPLPSALHCAENGDLKVAPVVVLPVVVALKMVIPARITAMMLLSHGLIWR